MNHNQAKMNAAYLAALCGIQSHIASIGAMVEAHELEYHQTPDWGYVGAMEHIASKLDEIAQFLRNSNS